MFTLALLTETSIRLTIFRCPYTCLVGVVECYTDGVRGYVGIKDVKSSTVTLQSCCNVVMLPLFIVLIIRILLCCVVVIGIVYFVHNVGR